jgi:hypothetical protein
MTLVRALQAMVRESEAVVNVVEASPVHSRIVSERRVLELCRREASFGRHPRPQGSGRSGLEWPDVQRILQLGAGRAIRAGRAGPWGRCTLAADLSARMG